MITTSESVDCYVRSVRHSIHAMSVTRCAITMSSTPKRLLKKRLTVHHYRHFQGIVVPKSALVFHHADHQGIQIRMTTRNQVGPRISSIPRKFKAFNVTLVSASSHPPRPVASAKSYSDSISASFACCTIMMSQRSSFIALTVAPASWVGARTFSTATRAKYASARKFATCMSTENLSIAPTVKRNSSPRLEALK